MPRSAGTRGSLLLIARFLDENLPVIILSTGGPERGLCLIQDRGTSPLTGSAFAGRSESRRVKRRRLRRRDSETAPVGHRVRETGNRSGAAPSYWKIPAQFVQEVELTEIDSFVPTRAA